MDIMKPCSNPLVSPSAVHSSPYFYVLLLLLLLLVCSYNLLQRITIRYWNYLTHTEISMCLGAYISRVWHVDFLSYLIPCLRITQFLTCNWDLSQRIAFGFLEQPWLFGEFEVPRNLHLPGTDNSQLQTDAEVEKLALLLLEKTHTEVHF